MYTLIVVLIILVAFFLVLVVLAQNPKGGGLSSQFGGSGSAQIMGVKKTGDLLEKLTWGFAAALLVLSMSTTFFADDSVERLSSPNLDNTQTVPQVPQPDASLQSSDDLGGAFEEADSTN